MRPIKFRQWDPYKKRMYMGIGASEGTWSGFPYVSWDKFPIMQFTGLLDRKGVEIYEGDIVEDILILPVTVDDQHGFRFMWGKDQLTRSNAVNGEVIGNIYSTPELLGGPQ